MMDNFSRKVLLLSLFFVILLTGCLVINITKAWPVLSTPEILPCFLGSVLMYVVFNFFVFYGGHISFDKKIKGEYKLLIWGILLSFLFLFLLSSDKEYLLTVNLIAPFTFFLSLILVLLYPYDREKDVLYRLWRRFVDNEEKEREVVKENEVETPIEEEVKDVK